MHVHAAAPITNSIYLMHFHSAKLWSHPLRVLCTCILSTRTIRKPQQREKNKYDGEGRERERERKEERREERRAFGVLRLDLQNLFPSLQSASFTINGGLR